MLFCPPWHALILLSLLCGEPLKGGISVPGFAESKYGLSGSLSVFQSFSDHRGDRKDDQSI
jgi:hypothetical protein